MGCWISSSRTTGVRFQSVPPTGKNPDCNYLGVPVYCGPRGLPPRRCLLYRNNGDGTFTDVTRAAGIDRAAPAFGLTAVAADYSEAAGRTSMSPPIPCLACCSATSGMVRLVEQGLQLGLAVNEDGTEQAGMGLGLGDFDTDGALDLLKTHFSEETGGAVSQYRPRRFRRRRPCARVWAWRRAMSVGAPASRTSTTTACRTFSGLPAASIRKWRRHIPAILIRRRGSYSGTWGTAGSRSWSP